MAKAREQTAGGEAFARDLGYLGAFFDKLEAHARTLGGERGARLLALIGEERVRWQEIRALVAGNSPAPSPAPAPASDAPATTATGVRAFTIGSLRKVPPR